ncbi:MAG: LuxR C-terminal-related transcriptional regulator [Trichodesmium sp. MAG_R04]|jgi:DNA-binding CsgD family transcriptional regulator|nr:LuxR C-terminal-related transcriptional regulator [Trichodesmium sp. MAG_R04]
MKNYDFSYVDITILDGLSNGLSIYQIEKILHLSRSSIKRHITKLMKIFNSLNKCHLVANYQKYILKETKANQCLYLAMILFSKL